MDLGYLLVWGEEILPLPPMGECVGSSEFPVPYMSVAHAGGEMTLSKEKKTSF